MTFLCHIALGIVFAFGAFEKVPAEDTKPTPSVRPKVLRDPLDAPERLPEVVPGRDDTYPLVTTEQAAHWGFSGPSGVEPTEVQTSSHFIPIEDPWRIGAESWDRYGKGHAPQDDYPGVEGTWFDPYNQNVLN